MAPALVLVALLGAAPAAAAAPDVLLISIDDLRADRVRPDLMPNLSRLSSESIRFTSAYSEATWTLPSHASLLTSLYPGSHGAGAREHEDARAMLPGALNLAQALSRRGYSASSYANCAYFREALGLVEGFLPRLVMPMFEDPLPDATLWFERMPSPGFLFLHTYWVHNYVVGTGPPRDASGSWRCPLSSDDWEARPQEKAQCADAAVAYDRAAYCVDQGLGRAFQELKAAGRWDSALIVVTSDHGESLCEGAKDVPRRGHGNMPYDEEIRVPLLVKLPHGRFAGRRVDSPARLIDVAPTVLDALGLPPEPAFQGRSLLPLAAGGREDDRPIFAEMDDGSAVRAGAWKLIRPDDRPAELYDLRADPGETRNVAAQRPARVRELQAALREHLGSQSAGWRVAARGPAGARFTLTARSNRPLALVMTAFMNPERRLDVSPDSTTVRAEFTSRSGDEEGWLIVEASTPTARLTLEALRDGRPPPEGDVRLGREALTRPGPWPLSGADALRRGTLTSPPAARDGISLWRAKAAVDAAAPGGMDPRIRAELRAAGYIAP